MKNSKKQFAEDFKFILLKAKCIAYSKKSLKLPIDDVEFKEYKKIMRQLIEEYEREAKFSSDLIKRRDRAVHLLNGI